MASNWFDKFFGGRKDSFEADFRALLDASFDGVLVLDDQRRVLEANGPGRKLFGLTRDELLQTKLDTFMCPGFTGLEQMWTDFLRHGSLSGGICLQRPDHIRQNFDYSARANFMPGYHVWVLRSTQMQQELMKQAQADSRKLAETNQFLEQTKIALVNALEDFASEKRLVEQEKKKIDAVVASIGDAVFVTDVSGHIILMNPIAERFCGYPASEALGHHYSRIFRFALEANPQTQFPDFVAEVVRTGQIRELSGHAILIKRDGSQFAVSDSAAPILDQQGNVLGCVVVVRDFTRERALEQAKDDFLSVAAHQLRTPLGALRWGMELLLSGDMGPLSGKGRESVEQYHDNILRMIGLVNDLLDVSRIDQGRIRDNPTPVQIEELVNKQIKLVEGQAQEKGVAITFLPPAAKLPQIMVDSARLGQVIENLLSNSIKYNKPQGKVEIKLGTEGDFIKLQVADTGVGIPKDAIPKMFGKFFRAENAVLSATEGTGLGLFVAKSYLEHWGGSISVESELGQGTTFTVMIPRAPKVIAPLAATAIPGPSTGI